MWLCCVAPFSLTASAVEPAEDLKPATVEQAAKVLDLRTQPIRMSHKLFDLFFRPAKPAEFPPVCRPAAGAGPTPPRLFRPHFQTTFVEAVEAFGV
jgi:hypothetical protein